MTYDAMRDKQRGQHGERAPRCEQCGQVSVLNPCRSCASGEPDAGARQPTSRQHPPEWRHGSLLPSLPQKRAAAKGLAMVRETLANAQPPVRGPKKPALPPRVERGEPTGVPTYEELYDEDRA